MRRQSIGRPIRGLHREAVAAAKEGGEVLQKRRSLWLKLADDLGHFGRKRHQLAADGFGQRAKQPADHFLAQPRHGPFEQGGRSRLSERERQFNGHAVVFLAGGIGVGQRHRLAADRHGIGKCRRVIAQELSARQFGFRDAKTFLAAGSRNS